MNCIITLRILKMPIRRFENTSKCNTVHEKFTSLNAAQCEIILITITLLQNVFDCQNLYAIHDQNVVADTIEHVVNLGQQYNFKRLKPVCILLLSQRKRFELLANNS